MLSPYALGIVFLVIVSLLWTACSMIVAYLYHTQDFDSPFLIVYIGTSLFAVFLPTRLAYERLNCCRLSSCEQGEVSITPWRNYEHPASSSCGNSDSDGLMASPQTPTTPRGNVEMNAFPYQDEPPEDDYSFNDEHCVQSFEPEERLTSPQFTSPNDGYFLSHMDHIQIAIKIAPIWFLSNWLYATSLQWTSIASSTVLASMGSIFSFMFATCSRIGDEKVTKGMVLGVLLCFMGGVATTWTDLDVTADEHVRLNNVNRHLRHPAAKYDISELDESVRTLVGDLAGLFSAVGYGLYTNLIRFLCPKDESKMSMQLMFGYIGLLNMLLLLPIAIWVNVSSVRDEAENQTDAEADDEVSSSVHTTTLTWSIFLFLVLKGLLDNVLSDYLWARAVILTSATVASVGVGLTIPMAFFADWFQGNYSGGPGEILGAISVVAGFIFVNIDMFGENPP